MFLGWQGLSSLGHLITLCSIFFFFLMFCDSFLESKLPTPRNLGFPRFNKRIQTYIYKVTFMQLVVRNAGFVKFKYRSQWDPRIEYEIWW